MVDCLSISTKRSFLKFALVQTTLNIVMAHMLLCLGEIEHDYQKGYTDTSSYKCYSCDCRSQDRQSSSIFHANHTRDVDGS